MGNELQGELRIKASLDASEATAGANEAKAAVDGITGAVAGETEQYEDLKASVSSTGEYFDGLKSRVAQLKVEIADLTEILQSDDLSLEEMQGALGRTTVVMADLRDVVAALQNSGQPVPASVLVALSEAQTKVAALTAEYHALATAEAEAGEAGASVGPKMAGAGGEIQKAATSTRGMRVALLDVTSALGGVIGEIAPWLLILTLLPTLIEQGARGFHFLADALSAGRDKLADWIEGNEEAIDVQKKKGESDQQYAERVKLATDLQQKQTEAIHAMNAGLIPMTEDLNFATYAWIAHEAALHPGPQIYALLAAAAKQAGVSVKSSFEEIENRAATMEERLRILLAVDGTKDVLAFGEANKSAIKEIIQGYEDAGQKVPLHIAAIAAALGILTTNQEKAVKLQKEYDDTLQKASDLYVASLPKLSALSIEVDKNAQAYVRSTAAIEEHRRETNVAIESETKTLVAGLFQQIEALKDRGLTQEEQTAEENKLLSKITEVRTDALHKELANNAASEQSQKDLDSKEAEQLIKFQERAKAQGASLETLGAIRDALKGKVEDLTGKIEAELKEHGLNAAAAVAASSRISTEASPKVASHADLIERVNTALRAGPDAMSAFVSGLDSGGAAADRFLGKLAAIQAKLDALAGTGGGASGSGGGAGGGF